MSSSPPATTARRSQTPGAPLVGGAVAQALAALVLGLLLVAANDAGHDALQAARAEAALRVDAVAVADSLAQGAGREAKAPGTLQSTFDDLTRRHGHRLGPLFAVREGGVDEFGISRGAEVAVGGDALDAASRDAVLDHAGALSAVAARAAADGAQIPWQRLLRPLAAGGTVLAVPFRTADDAPASGVAGVVLRPRAQGLDLPPWRWALALVPLLLWLGLVRVGLPTMAAGISAGLATVGAAIATLPPLAGATGGGVAILAAQLLVPHAPPPVNAALDSAELWLAGALLVLGAAGGAGLGGLSFGLSAARKDAAPYLYVGPSVLATGLLVFLPFGVGVGLSFLGTEGEFVGLQNYSAVLMTVLSADESTQLGRTFVHTVLWTAINVGFHVVIGLSLALLLNRPDLRFRKIYRLLLIVPWAVPSYITALTWKWLFNTQYGPINTMLAALGVDRVDWLGGSGISAFAANLATNVWLGFPFMMVISLGALQSIPAELYEAADIDGATGWQKLRHVTLPLLKPALFPAVILGTIWTFNAFNIIYLVSGGGPDHSTEILITEAYYLFTVLRRTGLAAAYAVLIFGLLLLYTLITNRMTRATEAVDR